MTNRNLPSHSTPHIFFAQYSESTGHFMLAAYFTMFSHPPTDTFLLIAHAGSSASTPTALQSFCDAAEVSNTELGHVAGGSTFWATHIPQHQLWGLKDLSRFA